MAQQVCFSAEKLRCIQAGMRFAAPADEEEEEEEEEEDDLSFF